MNKNLLYLTALAALSAADGIERRHEDIPTPPRVACKDCYFYTGGTFCKRVKHSINKQTRANDCPYFKER